MIDYKEVAQKLLKIHNIISGRNDTIEDLKQKDVDDSLTIVQHDLSGDKKSPKSCSNCRNRYCGTGVQRECQENNYCFYKPA